MSAATRPTPQTRAARKRLLVARSAVLRLKLAQQLDQSLGPTFRTVDRADRGWQWLKAHPLVWGAAAALLVLSRPRRLLGWGARAWALWETWQRLAPTVGPLWQWLRELKDKTAAGPAQGPATKE